MRQRQDPTIVAKAVLKDCFVAPGTVVAAEVTDFGSRDLGGAHLLPVYPARLCTGGRAVEGGPAQVRSRPEANDFDRGLQCPKPMPHRRHEQQSARRVALHLPVMG